VVKGFGRRPNTTEGAASGPAFESLPRRKTAGGKRLCLAARDLWGFEGGGLSVVSLREPQARDFVGLDEVGGLDWRRRDEGWA